MQTVVMVVEGILRAYGSEAHIDAGITLYTGLAQSSRLYLLSGVWNEEETAAWCFKNGLRGHIAFQKALSNSPADRLEALSRISSWAPALVFEADPVAAAEELKRGYPVCLVAHPVYGDPRWRPDHSPAPKPWEEVDAELKRQDALRFADERLKT